MSRTRWIVGAFVCAAAFVVLVYIFLNGLGVGDTAIIEPGHAEWAVLAIVCAVGGKVMIWLAIKSSRAQSLRRRGLCPFCGYDLRASTDRCPECGQPIR
jgi:hypothetical protein